MHPFFYFYNALANPTPLKYAGVHKRGSPCVTYCYYYYYYYCPYIKSTLQCSSKSLKYNSKSHKNISSRWPNGTYASAKIVYLYNKKKETEREREVNETRSGYMNVKSVWPLP